ncbi:MAG TPA: cupin domain-containing protein [Solirubrobacteraceae bacterium]
MTAANIFDPDFDELRAHPGRDGFTARRARVGRQAGARRLGASVWELDAGQSAYPYHLHLGEEELIVVLDGRPSLRGPDGWRELEPGEVVAFPRGEAGAHQIANRSEAVVRFLAVSTSGEPDIVLYPDAGKVAAAERREDGAGFGRVFFVEQSVDYWDGVDS